MRWRRFASLGFLGVALLVAQPAGAGCPGGWSVAATGGPSGQLLGVAGSSPSDAWAVGRQADTARGPLAFHWDGHSWRRFVVPFPGAAASLSAIALVPGTETPSYWAVGAYTDSRSQLEQPWIVRWNGHRWLRVPTPTFPAGATLGTIRVFRAGDVWVAGSKGSTTGLGNEAETLALHRVRQSWTVVPTPSVLNPDPGAGASFTNGIGTLAGTSSSDLWAFRYGGDAEPDYVQNFVDRRDGSSWSSAEAPAPGFEIWGALALSARNVWAVGWGWSEGSPRNPSLAAHWTGRAWELTPTPSPAGGPDDGDFLSGVAALSARSVWAVGGIETGVGKRAVLIERWDGGSWSVVGARLSGLPGFLWEVTRVPGSERKLWAVGRKDSSAGPRPLIVRRC